MFAKGLEMFGETFKRLAKGPQCSKALLNVCKMFKSFFKHSGVIHGQGERDKARRERKEEGGAGGGGGRGGLGLDKH